MSDYKFDKDDLLDKTNGGLDVIRRLYSACEKNGKFVHFKMRAETTASANVFKKGNVYKVKDHGDGPAKNAIDLVMEDKNLSFSDACKWIAQEFSIDGNKPTSNRSKLEIKKATKKQKHGQYFFKYKEFTQKELAVLGPLVTSEICRAYNVKCCESFTQIKTYEEDDKYNYGNDTMQIITKSTDKYPIFVFDFGTWQKIYQPLSDEKGYRFRHAGTKPPDFVFGLENVKSRFKKIVEDSDPEDEEDPKIDKIIIASGDRDALNLASLGYSVVWLNSETAKLTYDTYKVLSERANTVYYLGDIDETGVKESVKLALDFININIIWLPDWLKKFKYRGKFCKDFKDFVDHSHKPDDSEFLDKQFKKLLYNALPARFWDEVIEKDKVKWYFNNEACYRFLQYKGFFRFEEDTVKEEYSFIHINSGIVKRVPLHHLSNFPGEYIKQNQSNIGLLNFIHRSAQLNEKSLAKLEQMKIDFTDCSYDHQLLHFKNKVWSVTKDEIKEYKYGELDTHVWEDKIIPHEVKVSKTPSFKITHDGSKYDIEILNYKNHFLNYLINTSRVYWRKCGDAPFKMRLKAALRNGGDEQQYNKDVAQIKKERKKYREDNKFCIDEKGLSKDDIQTQKEHLINKIYAYGYLLHKKKVDDKAWCVFAMDNAISDISDSNGGSGKSLMLDKAVRSILLSNQYKAGRDTEMLKNKHMYEGVDKYCDYVIYDDLDSRFPFSKVFSEITGDLSVNPKNAKQYVLPYSESPKFAMTSNFGVFNADTSTNRRILYMEFSDYYHHKSKKDECEHKPTADFGGKMLFSQFDKDEWNDFFNISAEAIKFYLGQPTKIGTPVGNIETRNAVQTMGQAFYEWANSYFSDERQKIFIHKKIACDDFIETQGVKNWSVQRFVKALKLWCEIKDIELNPDETLDKQGRCKHNFSGKAVDALFLQPKGFQIEDLNKKLISQIPNNDVDPTDDLPF